jgi:glucokinase
VRSLSRLSALDRLAGEAAVGDPDSPLGRRRPEGKPVFGADVVRAARAGAAMAVRVVEILGERVGIGVANAINTFDPDEVVIGGAGAQAGELLLEAVRRMALAYLLPGVGRRTRIRSSIRRIAGAYRGSASALAVAAPDRRIPCMRKLAPSVLVDLALGKGA